MWFECVVAILIMLLLSYLLVSSRRLQLNPYPYPYPYPYQHHASPSTDSSITEEEAVTDEEDKPNHSTAMHERSVGLVVVRLRKGHISNSIAPSSSSPPRTSGLGFSSSSTKRLNTPPTAPPTGPIWEVLLIGRKAKGADGRPVVELPKGHVEKGESLDEAAVRELLEETGASGVNVGKEIYRTTYKVRSSKLKDKDGKRMRVDKTVSFHVAIPDETFNVDARKREKATHTVIWLTAYEATGPRALVHWRGEHQVIALRALELAQTSSLPIPRRPPPSALAISKLPASTATLPSSSHASSTLPSSTLASSTSTPPSSSFASTNSG
eukprot:gb/GEZN01008760.1/.p1 GENE.gb/GEZN01008760.1/~~gb/GEZN01008760.1/.p1  ORF type:complete len:325 (-),score=66.13 gb/GEZN01008760.1/:306-1280(-)